MIWERDCEGKKCRCHIDIGIPAFGHPCWGKFFSFCFRFLTLTCYLVFFFFSLSCILLITLLCYVLYVNSVIVCYLPPPLFLPEFYVFISVTVFVAVAFFLGFPDHQPLLSSAFGKRLRFHRFLQFRFAVAFR